MYLEQVGWGSWQTPSCLNIFSTPSFSNTFLTQSFSNIWSILNFFPAQKSFANYILHYPYHHPLIRRLSLAPSFAQTDPPSLQMLKTYQLMDCFLCSPSLIVWSWVMHPPMHCRALFKSWARCQSICKRAREPSSPDQLRYFSATAATQNFPRAPLSASRAEKWLFGEIQPRVEPQEAGQQCDDDDDEIVKVMKMVIGMVMMMVIWFDCWFD